MSDVTINDIDVSEMQMSLPRVGAWTANLFFVSDAPPTGSVTIKMGDASFSGTVVRSGTFNLFATCFVVGGKGGLGKTGIARQYQDYALVRSVTQDLLSDGGESLSSDSDSSLLSTNIGNWSTTADVISHGLDNVLSFAGADYIWRVKPDGTVFVGADSYPDFTTEIITIDRSDYDGRLSLFQVFPTIMPGVTLDGRKISYVQHRYTGSDNRTVAFYE